MAIYFVNGTKANLTPIMARELAMLGNLVTTTEAIPELQRAERDFLFDVINRNLTKFTDREGRDSGYETRVTTGWKVPARRDPFSDSIFISS